jgi:hypothetical protein
VYSRLTLRREQSPKGTSEATAPPGLKTYVDAVAALVPADILALHALAVSVTTKTDKGPGGDPVTVITKPDTLKVVFFVLIAWAIVEYVLGHRFSTPRPWDRSDTVRALIPALAFVAWTMLQKATAFDAFAPSFDETTRALIAAFAAVVLGTLAKLLADRADEADPAPALG